MLSWLAVLAFETMRDDLTLMPQESRFLPSWTVEGTAFGSGPVDASTQSRLEIVNASSNRLISSEIGGDEPQGTLSSPKFAIDRDFIAFRIGGGDYERHCCLELLIEDRVVRSATGRHSDRLQPQSWDVRDFRGKEARLRIVDRASGDWGHINVDGLVQTDHPERLPVALDPVYSEKFRPQFHFTARQWTMNRLNPGMRQEGWINDLNGLIFYDGEYHLFAQRWHKCWLHAVSRDLMHWTELEPAFWAEELDEGVQSGTCVVDYKNTSGLSSDPKNPPMVAFWSTVDNQGQALHYSLDHGRTWRPHPKNPVLKFPERDPKVFWYEPGQHWVMFLYGGGDYHILTSANLLDWKDEKNPIRDGFECPDFFELPVDGDSGKKKWVLVHGDGRYSVGSFNGRAFTEETPRRLGDIGPNFYATQSWENTVTGDGRRIQAAWMRGSDFPDMPFNQQVSFPCELTLRNTPDGLRLFRQPIKEIDRLREDRREWRDLTVREGASVTLADSGDLYRIRAEIDLAENGTVTFWLRGIPVTLTRTEVQSGGAAAKAIDRIKSVEILLDRGSIEAFINGGEISSTRYALPSTQGLSLESSGPPARIHSLTVDRLKSSWEKP